MLNRSRTRLRVGPHNVAKRNSEYACSALPSACSRAITNIMIGPDHERQAFSCGAALPQPRGMGVRAWFGDPFDRRPADSISVASLVVCREQSAEYGAEWQTAMTQTR